MIDINGVRLEVQRIAAAPGAPPGRAPLVFLHEGLGSVAMWTSRDGDWPAQLCKATGRAGLVYSRRGYGQSDSVPDVRGPSREYNGQRIGRLLPDYMHREAWDVLPALLTALHVERPVLVGHSDGGTIALLHASTHPVAACVVMAPHVVVEDVSLAAIVQARSAYESGALRERLARYHADVDCAFWQWNDVWLSDGFRGFDIRSDCGRIAAPTLALQGEDDPYGTMRQIDEIYPANARIEREKLPNCGHSPHKDHPTAVINILGAFLGRVA